MEKDQKKIKDFAQLLSIANANFNILEEEINVHVQKEYFALLNEIGKNPDTFPQLTKNYLEDINDLFDETIDPEIKKKMLVILATIDDVATYRSIESFSKQHSPLQEWAIIALQQSRMLLQSSLLDDPGFYISTGLGGQGSLLRYFCVFPFQTKTELPEFQKKILKEELLAMIHNAQGSLESIEYHRHYAIAIVLFSLQTDIPRIFADFIDECNQYGHFLTENIIITNVKKLSEEEILKSLQHKTKL